MNCQEVRVGIGTDTRGNSPGMVVVDKPVVAVYDSREELLVAARQQRQARKPVGAVGVKREAEPEIGPGPAFGSPQRTKIASRIDRGGVAAGAQVAVGKTARGDVVAAAASP